MNRSQSTNDAYPTAQKIATYEMIGPRLDALQDLAGTFDAKAREFKDTLHLSRTCLQNAQPMRLGHVFKGYAAVTHSLPFEPGAVREKLLTLALGDTAIGTG